MSYLEEEIAAYAHMQARLVTLLLRHSEQRFGASFGLQQHYAQEEQGLLQHYRDLAVLFILRDELFDDILPRIVRRLSFESPRSMLLEDPPPRGRVDWERTLASTWAERPGEPPLQLQTRQRRRDFATPENLLTVLTLLQYRADIQQLLWGEYATVGAESLRHPLHEIVLRCERELAFPQFAGMRSAAQQILEQDGSAALEAQVHERLLPGSNSAYEALLSWRMRYQSLQLLQRRQRDQADDVLGADPNRDNYFYQLWLYYELADFLKRHGKLQSWDHGVRQLLFRWGDGEQERSYQLCYDQKISDLPRIWPSAPGVRPDFYIRHAQQEPVDGSAKLIWHEPGFVLDAKYYRPREEDDPKIPAGPVKRMLADLQLMGEQHGALLFAFHGKAPAATVSDTDSDRVPLESGMQIVPNPAQVQLIAPDMSIALYRIQPQAAETSAATDAILHNLLSSVHNKLQQRRIPQCYGIFLDTLSAAEAGTLYDRWGKELDSDPQDLLICPKPHIGTWRVDLVSRAQHCCRDPRLCHIVGRPAAQRPIRPPRTIQDLLGELEQLLASSKESILDEQGEAAAVLAKQIEKLTRTFAEIAQVKPESYFPQLRDLGLVDTLDLIGAEEQISLAIGIYLKNQLDLIGAQDFSAPAIHISSVMEIEIQRRLFKCPDLIGDLAHPKKQTLGALPFLYINSKTHKYPGDPEVNWQNLQRYADAHWNIHPEADNPELTIQFTDFIAKALDRIGQLRNIAAHTQPLSRKDYADLQKIIFQGGKLGYGALNTLLLCWKGDG